jgi:YHS domain-containing protein
VGELSRRLALASLFCTLSNLTGARSAEVVGTNPDKRVAIRGYDPVSYFMEGRPVQGAAEFSAEFDDATYWFKSAENRAVFMGNPDKYAPQFGGLCAVTIAQGRLAEPDPEAWVIADGKLYLFGAKEAVPLFRQETGSVVSQATEKWQKLRHQP